MHHAQALVFPAVIGSSHGGVHVVAPATDLAVHRPHHERVAAGPLQRVEVGQGAGQRGGVAWRVAAGAHLRGSDGGEGAHRFVRAGPPEGGVGNVVALVRIERDDDAGDPCATRVDERRQALHVGVRAAHGQRGSGQGSAHRVGRAPGLGQVAEVVLRVDDQQGDLAVHGVLLGRW
ncbi:hypothetical protein FQZ97_1061270 [compost metagenome]